MTSPTAPVINSFPYLTRSFPCIPLKKDPYVIYQNPTVFGLNWLILAWEPQNTLHTDPNKGMFLSLCLYPTLTSPCDPLVCCVHLPGPVRLEYFLKPYTKISWKWIKDLNVKPETIKILEENIGRTFFDINHSNVFLDLFYKAKEIKEK